MASARTGRNAARVRPSARAFGFGWIAIYTGGYNGEFSMIRSALAAAALLALFSPAARAAEILIQDEKSQPESLTVAADGAVIAGSASSPYVYRVRKGATASERFIDASAEGPGTFFFGQLADASTGTLWTCQLTPVPGVTPVARHSSLRGFDLQTGKEKLRWNLPGDNSMCNDFSIGPDKALYIADTANAKIYRLAPGAQSADLFLDNRVLLGVDGITFLNGVLYVNNVTFSKLYRIPLDASGKAGRPVDIWMDAPVLAPDGMRAANGKLFVAENGGGKVDALTITGDTAHVTVLKDGLKTPTGVEPAGDTLWLSERGAGKVWSIPMPK
jgi:sugar lactone lactonase YvrE